MLRLVPLYALALFAACGDKTFPSLCKDEVPPPAACMSACDPKPGAPDTCPAGFYCNPDGKCDAQCVPGAMPNQCGDGYTCLPDGTCVNNADCTDPACKVVNCKGMNMPSTTISGTVFAPNGTLPLYGISVYVPDTDPGPMPSGLSCQKCTDTLPGNPIGKPVTTDEMGKFTLTDMPSGIPLELVITSGKWRRIVKLPTVNQCTDNAVGAADTTLPKSADDMTPNTVSVSMPKIAITTGGADSLECLVRKLGIADKEIGTNTGTGHVHLYQGNGVSQFDGGFAGGTGNLPSATPFWKDTANLVNYDIVIFSCEGAQNPNTKPEAAIDAVKAYADMGGRVFASHWHNIWIGGAWASGGNPPGSPVWDAIAQWNDANDPGSPDLIDEASNPKGPSFAQWMLNVGGSTVRDQIPIQSGTDRQTAMSIDMAKAERWTYTQSTNAPQNFQFTTPNEADPGSRCGKVVFSDMHVSGGPSGQSYPSSCGGSTMMSPQEKALAFMFFDIASCVGTIF